MTNCQLPTQAEIKEILHYDPETGVFRWRFATANSVNPWDVAGSSHKDGYIRIKLKSRSCLAHRLAYKYMTGDEPFLQIDHIDGVRSNNKWSNLRPANAKQNCENIKMRSDNTSGYRGVSWHKKIGKWASYVSHNKKIIHLGYFDLAEKAALVSAAKRAELFSHDMGRDKAAP